MLYSQYLVVTPIEFTAADGRGLLSVSADASARTTLVSQGTSNVSTRVGLAVAIVIALVAVMVMLCLQGTVDVTRLQHLVRL